MAWRSFTESILTLSPRARHFLAIVFVLSIALRIYLAIVTPRSLDSSHGNLHVFNDEAAHFRYIQYLDEHHSLPVNRHIIPPGDPDIVEKLWIFNEFEYGQPPLYYLLSVPFVHTPDPLLYCRFFSIALSSVALLLIVLCAVAAFEKPDLPAACAMTLAGLHPVFLRIGSSVSNDNLTWLISSALFWIWIRGGFTRRKWWAGVWMGLGILTKMSMLIWPLFLCANAAFIAAKARSLRRGVDEFRKVLPALVVAVVICGWWILRNHAVYGDWMGVRAIAPWPGRYLSTGSFSVLRDFFAQMIRYSYFPIAEESPRFLLFVEAASVFFLLSLFLQWQELSSMFYDRRLFAGFVLFQILNAAVLMNAVMKWANFADPRYLLTGFAPMVLLGAAVLIRNARRMSVAIVFFFCALYWVALW